MKKYLLLILSLLVSLNSLFSQNVIIPDSNFKQKLIDVGCDVNNDNEISFSEAEAVDSINVSEKDTLIPGFNKIKDLTGIEAFINLVYFDCGNNQINGSVDFSNNQNLEYLNCAHNTIDTLNLNNLRQLGVLNIYFNDISVLDLSTNINLKSINISFNNLSEIDITNNIKLEVFYCIGNSFTKIDFSKNINLKELIISGAFHNITEMDISNCTELSHLTVSYIDIIILDISQNQNLQKLAVNFLSNLEKICVWEIPFPSSIEVVSNINPIPFEICGTSLNFKNYDNSPIHKYYIDNVLYVESKKNVEVELISLNGQLLKSKKIAQNTIERIDMSNYANGIYLLKVKWQNFVISEKLIK